jgi:hypothetical protein
MTQTARGLLWAVVMLGVAFAIVEGLASSLENRQVTPTETEQLPAAR